MTRRIDNIIDAPGALILGAGMAGLFTALKLSPFPALVLAGARPGTSGSSAWAQGGIAAAMDAADSWQSHAADTMVAGAGTCDPEIVNMVARDAPARINDLIAYGAPFDRKEDGALALGREAAHSAKRIVHVRGDRAGAEVTRTLAERALETSSIQILEGFHALELAVADGRVTGVFARYGMGRGARLVLFRAKAVIFATGGLGALYAVTTNPLETRGEGLGMAARAGAVIADAEFVQFHPTAIAVGRDPAPLATEALRGEGAILIDETGHRFMTAIHPDAELAPRDVVARAIHRQIARGHKTFLDCRQAIGAKFADRFPTVYAACLSAGIDPAAQPIPVAPAAHYHMGGIASDARGRSSLEGLWAVGECASTGLHGANRLASNSLLETLAFGARAADDVRGAITTQPACGTPPAPERFNAPPPPQSMRDAMTRHVGMERDAAGLGAALAALEAVERAGAGEPALLNMTAAAKLVTAAALIRRESRGGHFRSDALQTDAVAKRSFLTLADAGKIAADAPVPAKERRVPLALPFTHPPHPLLIEPIVLRALEEDLGRAGDITSDLVIPAKRKAKVKLAARKPGTIAGLIAAEAAFRFVDPDLIFTAKLPDGSQAKPGALVATIEGSARSILTGERVALNFTGHFSGIATATRALVDAVRGTKARIVCTRKTTPGLRVLEKYAVRCGGGFNHRFGLDDAVLIKDNHIAAAGSITKAVKAARAGTAHMVRIEVEVDTLKQLEEALQTGVDTILLDNMTPDVLRRAVETAKGRAVLEASGNIAIDTVRAVAETGVDYISSGAITHSAINLDLGLDF